MHRQFRCIGVVVLFIDLMSNAVKTDLKILLMMANFKGKCQVMNSMNAVLCDTLCN